MARSQRILAGWKTSGGVAIVLSAIALLAFLWWLWGPRGGDASMRLTISAGSASGTRHLLAQRLVQLGQKRGLNFELIATQGSADALDELNAGRMQLALVQGGLGIADAGAVRQVAVLQVEPLHLLVKPLPSEATGTDRPPGEYSLQQVAAYYRSQAVAGDEEDGRPRELLRLNLSEEGSGTRLLAESLLEFFDMRPGVDFESWDLSYADLMREDLAPEELPDAVFTVSPLPSPVARRLIEAHGYRLVELDVAAAFRIGHGDPPADGAVPGQLDRRVIDTAVIPAYTYQVTPPVPDRPVSTLGTRLQLVAHKDVPPAIVEQILDCVYSGPLANETPEALRLSLLESSAEFPLHTGAEDYLRKKTPLITEQVVSVTEQVLAILGTVCGGLLFLWQALLFTRRRRRDRQFLQCIERVSEIEQRTMEFERNSEMKVAQLIELQAELNGIKSDMIAQFQRGDIDGADTLSGFLIHVNDANENLTRMILHEREPR